MSRPQTIHVDAEFIASMPFAGNDFMIRAAVDRPDAFDAAIDAGWADMHVGHWFQRDFLKKLIQIKDPALAADVLGKFLANRTPEEINVALFEKIGTDACPARSWFTSHNGTAEWRKSVLDRAIDLGMDLKTTISHSGPSVPSVRCTLLGSFVIDATSNMRFNGLSPTAHSQRKHLESLGQINELIDLGSDLDKGTLSLILKHHKDAGLKEILNAFDQRGKFEAAECLKMVSRMTIDPQNLAYLQSRAAMDAIDASLPKFSAMPTGKL